MSIIICDWPIVLCNFSSRINCGYLSCLTWVDSPTLLIRHYLKLKYQWNRYASKRRLPIASHTDKCISLG